MSKEIKVPAGQTLAQVLKMGEDVLVEADVPEAVLNAWYLFAHCFRTDRSHFFLDRDRDADQQACERFEKALGKRCRRIPLEHITNETEFMGLPFYVDERVLIPRQDTECLVEEALTLAQGKKVLDLCTGSGCIGVSIAALGKPEEVVLADISPEALEVAGRNAEDNRVMVRLCQSDLLTEIREKFDVIVSNPPYIASAVIPELMPEVRDHDPLLALDGGKDGLDLYRRIIKGAPEHLSSGGWLLFEIGYDQGEDLKKLMCDAGFEKVQFKKDLARMDRIAMGQYID